MRVALQSLHDRTVEWLSSLLMGAWCITLALPGETLSQPVYTAFHRFGMTEAAWAIVFGVVCIARLVALYINGRWPRSPKIRIIGASFGALSWGQVSALLYQASAANGTPLSTGCLVYALLAVFEVYSAYRAAFDVRYHQPS